MRTSRTLVTTTTRTCHNPVKGNGRQKQYPLQTKDVNMIYPSHTFKKDRKRAVHEVYSVESIGPKYNPWSKIPITFICLDHQTIVRHGGMPALVLDPIFNGFHLIKLLMDGGSSLNLSYADTLRKMHFNKSCIELAKTKFKGIITGMEAHWKGHTRWGVRYPGHLSFGASKLRHSPFQVWLSLPPQWDRVHALWHRPTLCLQEAQDVRPECRHHHLGER